MAVRHLLEPSADTEKPMGNLIQICASQNDLFGLDADGVVYQYNFHTNEWLELGRGRSDTAGVPPVADQPSTTYSEAAARRAAGQRSERRS
jgi:hypothetical protein